MSSQETLDAYLTERDALIERAGGGTKDAAALASLTDRAIFALAEAALSAAAPPIAVFALGGYGSGRLLPHSDIDLLMIVPSTKSDLEGLVHTLLYPLWDAGLTVGHQVRTPAQHAAALAADVANLTSFLTARFIAGDERLARETVERAFKRIQRMEERVSRSLGDRERPGSPYLLEPDLKGGAGGQRDIDELVWRAALCTGAPARSHWPLVAHGLLTPAEASSLDEAQDVVTHARWRLHRHAGRASNALILEATYETDIDADTVQRAIESIHHVLANVRDRSAGRPAAPRTPIGLQDLKHAAQRGLAAVPDLERAAWDGRFETIAPGFRDAMTLRRPALSHRYTVGAHCLRTLALCLSPFDGAPRTLPVGLVQALLVAAFAHDLGKREGTCGHAERSAAQALDIARRLRLPPSIGSFAATLVREHLLLAEVATTRDLDDEDVILRCAARVGHARLVDALVMLTAADMRATSADVWTPWRAVLIFELADKMRAALSPDVDGTGIVAAAKTTRTAALQAIEAMHDAGRIADYLERAPLRYLARRTVQEVLRDAVLADRIARSGLPSDVALQVTAGPAPKTWVVDVVTRDRPGRFATIAGTITLQGLDVLRADAFTTPDGIVLDTFTVASATRATVDDATWARLERELRLALEGRLDLELRLAERRRHYPAPRTPHGFRITVRVLAIGRFTATVHVHAPARVGLLYDLAHTIARANLDIRRATILTNAGIADDTFDVVDADGQPPDPKELTSTVLPALRAVVRSRTP